MSELIESVAPRNDLLSPYPFAFLTKNEVMKNIIDGPYMNVEHYVDIQFKLLKEDFEESLRADYQLLTEENSKPSGSNSNIYRNVTVTAPSSSSGQFDCHKVSFETFPRMNNIDWAVSKKFMHGSLLIIWKNDLRKYHFATVKTREPLESRRKHMYINFIGDPPSNSVMKSCMLFESTSYFEPYFQVLNTLLNMSKSNFPMRRYIIETNTSTRLPTYLSTDSVYEINDRRITLCDDNSWPTADQLMLNDGQKHALKVALTSEFAVIQGPPGTGKTYLCLRIIETLLANKSSFQKPILVVCYKNHALDQILESLLQKEIKVLRFGGQSKNKDLRETFNVSKITKEKVFLDKTFSLELRELQASMKTTLKEMIRCYKLMATLEDACGVVSFDMIEAVLKLNQRKAFQRGSISLLSWLFNDIIDKINIDSFINSIRTLQRGKIKPVPPENYMYFDLFNVCEEFRETGPSSSLLSLYDLEIGMKRLRDSILSSELENIDEIKQKLRLFNASHMIYLKMKERLNATAVKTKSTDLMNCDNLNSLSIQERWQLYSIWKDNVHRDLERQIIILQKKYAGYKGRFDRHNNALKAIKIQKFAAQVIGATTTSAARCHSLISKLKPEIVIIEEAAEVLEAHTVVSLTKHCQHLIMIGDHKQLKPNPASYRLAEHFHLNVSLFERMINNKMNTAVLNVQHRMRPEICSLITPFIYPKLDNHSSVLNYPAVVGCDKNLFFVNHTVEEDAAYESFSKLNMFEGDFLIMLCSYLLHQGYKPKDITILATYSAQSDYIRSRSRKLKLLAGVHITVVDNFQGEENRIILLSIVRSNKNASIGFLAIENRVCVALSRAREGFFMIGNMNSLVSKSNLWTAVNTSLIRNECIGSNLPLRCRAHDVLLLCGNADHLEEVLTNGCGRVCNMQMICKHYCPAVCHVKDFEHKSDSRCKEECQKKCLRGHRCEKFCGDTCLSCVQPVSVQLKCGHSVQLPCYKTVNPKETGDNINTIEMISNAFEGLLLENSNEGDSYAEVVCKVPCNFMLKCGHVCKRYCHMDDKEHDQYACEEKCLLLNNNCPVSHPCEKKCSEECGRCVKLISKKLSCGHQIKLECSKEVTSINNCTKICKKTLNCGHKCKNRCNELCSESSCDQPKVITSVCGHDIKVACHILKQKGPFDWTDIFSTKCRKPCRSVLKCGHTCLGTCGECVNGKFHKKCLENCSLQLLCGHYCSAKCSDYLHVCKRRCLNECAHWKCNQLCSVDCKDRCQEECPRKCRHLNCYKMCSEKCDEKCFEACPIKLKCGHSCRGFCGYMCPSICFECGTAPSSDHSNTRYVVLDDCGHTISADCFAGNKISTNCDEKIMINTCPKCKVPIVKTTFFKEEIDHTLRLISTIKTHLTTKNDLTMSKIQNTLETLIKIVKNQDNCEMVEVVSLLHKLSIPFIIGAKDVNDRRFRSLHYTANYMLILSKIYEKIRSFERKEASIRKMNLLKPRFELIVNKLLETELYLSLEQMFQFKVELQKLIANINNINLYSSYIEDVSDTIYSLPIISDGQRGKECISEGNSTSEHIDERAVDDLAVSLGLQYKTMHIGEWLLCPQKHHYNSNMRTCPTCSNRINGNSS